MLIMKLIITTVLIMDVLNSKTIMSSSSLPYSSYDDDSYEYDYRRRSGGKYLHDYSHLFVQNTTLKYKLKFIYKEILVIL